MSDIMLRTIIYDYLSLKLKSMQLELIGNCADTVVDYILDMNRVMDYSVDAWIIDTLQNYPDEYIRKI